MTSTKSKEFAPPILPPGDPKRDLLARFWHLGLWGPAGAGKTRFIASAGAVPDLSPILLVDAEEGDVTVDTGKHENVDILRVVDWQDQKLSSTPSVSLTLWDSILDIVTWIESFVTVINGTPTMGERFPYKFVGIDGGTTIQDWCDSQVVRENQNNAGNKELSTQPDFRIIASRMSGLFWRIKRLPVHTAFTARQRLDETQHSTKDAKQYRASANFYPKAGDEFNGMWDVLAFMDREPVGLEQSYTFQTRLSSKIVAKSRAGDLLDPSIENPDASKIFAQLWGKGHD